MMIIQYNIDGSISEARIEITDEKSVLIYKTLIRLVNFN